MSSTYGFSTGDQSVPGCFMCPGNQLLAFRPMRLSDTDAVYVMPGSMPVKTESGFELIPFPLSAVVVPTVHQPDPTLWGHGFPDDWTGLYRRVLESGLIPDLSPGDARNEITNIGFAAGARIPAALTDAGRPAHAFLWVLHGREALAESEATVNLGMATQLHQSRVDAGSVPPTDALVAKWHELRDEPDGLHQYNQWVLRWRFTR